MKIEKSTNGGVIIKDANGAILHIIKASNIYLQRHPRAADAIVISNTPTPQDAYEGIQLIATKVRSINGTAFSGDRDALLLALDELFKLGGVSGEGLKEVLAEIEKARPRVFKQLDGANRGFSTNWGNGFTTATRTIRDGWEVNFHVEIPCRNDYTSWGGGYAEVQYSINGAAFRSLGNSGYQLAMSNSAAVIHTYVRSFLLTRSQLAAPATGDFTIQFRMRHRSYQRTLYINRSSGTSTQDFLSTFIIKETKFN